MKLLCLLFLILQLLILTKSSLLPFLDDVSYILTKTSPKCQKQLYELSTNLRLDLNSWALQMLDATSKIPSGMLSYHVSALGDFDQCINIEGNTTSGKIFGKYCLGNFHVNRIQTNTEFSRKPLIELSPDQITFLYNLEQIGMRTESPGSLLGLCIPDGCTSSDAEIIGNHLLWEILGQNFSLEVNEDYCQTIKDVNKEFTYGALVTIFILAALLCWVLFCTFYAVYFKNKCPVMIKIFSLYSNISKLMKISKPNRNQIPCLGGLKFFSMLWVIVGHQHAILLKSVLINGKEALEWTDSLYSMFYVSGTFAVDTFLTITGLLISYTFMKSKELNIKFNLFAFYLYRYVRLTTPLILSLLVYSTLLSYMGSGPRWPYIAKFFQQNCVDYWWTVLLYIQNYMGTIVHKPCIGQTWYVCVDMQLYIISPAILHFLWKRPNSCLVFLGTCIVVLTTLSFHISWNLQVTAILSSCFRNMDDRAISSYFETHMRATPWVIGVIMGYCVFKIKQKQFHLQLGRGVVVLGWVICFAILFICVLGGHSTLRGPEHDKFWNAMHIALTRPAWAVAICWIILVCITNNGEPVNCILSCPLYQVFNRFIYSIYLVHLIVIYMVVYYKREAEYYNPFSVVYYFWGTLGISTLVAIPMVLLLETPIEILKKILLDKYIPKKAATSDIHSICKEH